jgi:hypothetical protein
MFRKTDLEFFKLVVPNVISSNKCRNVLRINFFDHLRSKCFDVSERLLNFHDISLHSINFMHPSERLVLSFETSFCAKYGGCI